MKLDKEISHPIHPHHKLKLEYTETPFFCDGCKEAGIGLKYRCTRCEFDLHKACALARPIVTHPFYPRCAITEPPEVHGGLQAPAQCVPCKLWCEFRLHLRPPGSARRACDACRNEVLGLVYHCSKCGFDLHPCCAALPRALDDGERALYLCHKLPSGACHRCGGKGGLGWAYRSECGAYNLHVSCVKELLVESWQAMYFKVDKDKVREIQTRIPSLRGTLKSHHGRGGKVKKCCEIAGGAVRIIVSAILGDPTALIGAAIGSFMAK